MTVSMLLKSCATTRELANGFHLCDCRRLPSAWIRSAISPRSFWLVAWFTGALRHKAFEFPGLGHGAVEQMPLRGQGVSELQDFDAVERFLQDHQPVG